MALVRAPYKIAPDYGEYQLVMATGALTVVASPNPIWSCQWTSSALVMIVKEIDIHVDVITAYGTAQVTTFGLYIARSYTAADTGGTAATLTGNNGKLDSKYPTTSLADMRIGTTGAITAGTRTLDTQPLDVFNFQTNALGNAQDEWQNWGMADDRQQIIIRQNEGLVLNNMVTMGATGVLNVYVSMTWAEVPISDIR